LTFIFNNINIQLSLLFYIFYYFIFIMTQIDWNVCNEQQKAYLLEAVRENGYAIQYILNPSEQVLKLSKMSFSEKFHYLTN